MSSSNCQISNVTFQMSNFKSHVGDNPSCSIQQLIQNPVANFRISNLKCQMSNSKFQNLNFKGQILFVTFQMSNFKSHEGDNSSYATQ